MSYLRERFMLVFSAQIIVALRDTNAQFRGTPAQERNDAISRMVAGFEKKLFSCPPFRPAFNGSRVVICELPALYKAFTGVFSSAGGKLALCPWHEKCDRENRDGAAWFCRRRDPSGTIGERDFHGARRSGDRKSTQNSRVGGKMT